MVGEITVGLQELRSCYVSTQGLQYLLCVEAACAVSRVHNYLQSLQGMKVILFIGDFHDYFIPQICAVVSDEVSLIDGTGPSRRRGLAGLRKLDYP